LEVEVDEKPEVDGEQDTAKHRRIFCTGTIANVREALGEILSSSMFVSYYKWVNEGKRSLYN
jgi:hypothetical protein